MLNAIYYKGRKRIQSVLMAACFLILLYLVYTLQLGHPTRYSSMQRITDKSLIPHKVWQILITPTPGSEGAKYATKGVAIPDATSWVSQNPDLTYTLLGTEGAKSFLEIHYADQPEILETFNAIGSPAVKSDFLRYLILFAEGGIYSDIDTRALRPIHQWIPEAYKAETKAVFGIEYDQLDNEAGTWDRPLQFAQFTIAAAPGHPILAEMINRSLENVQKLARNRHTALEDTEFEDEDVMDTTGPPVWTDVVWNYINQTKPQFGDGTVRSLSGMTKPALHGDVLVLPINGFGMGQRHSKSARWRVPQDALVRHYFKGSWRLHPWN